MNILLIVAGIILLAALQYVFGLYLVGESFVSYIWNWVLFAVSFGCDVIKITFQHYRQKWARRDKPTIRW